MCKLSKKLVSTGASEAEVVDSRDNKNYRLPLTFNYRFQSRSEDPRLYLDVRIFGRLIRALLDTGASRTVIGKNGLEVLKNFPARITNVYDRYVETADGERHLISGVVNLPITLEGRTRDMKALVVPNLEQTLILGVDFWDAMHILTDVHSRTWEFSGFTGQLCSLDVNEGILPKHKLSDEQIHKLDVLIEEHFPSTGKQTIGMTDQVMHVIDTGDANPIKQRHYTMSPVRQKLVEEELDRMLELKVVEPSKSPWSSPIVLLDKPDGSRRFCINFKALNAVTKPDAYPLPKVTNILDRLRDARYLSSLDIKSAFWQIPLDPASKEKTAFTVPGRGLYHFNAMPFGLHNAPATWQRFIDSVLGPELEPYVFVYLDDIIAITPTYTKHLEVLTEIFKRVRAAKLTLNREKCIFCRQELKYLGYVVSEEGLRVDPDKVQAIVDIPVPRNQKDVRQFVGTASWYRRFISNFSTRLYPLTSMLKKGKRFEWNSEAQESWDDIRSCLIKSPILSCPNFDKPFTIACDASGVGLGAVLSQESEKGEIVVAYASRTLTRGEQNFSVTERECLAVLWAIEKFRPYVEGTRFTVITDHYSLLWLLNLKDPQGRLARWSYRLQPYDFKLVHRKGKDHVVPDMLSRAPVEGDSNVKVPVEAHSNTFVGEIHENTLHDNWYLTMVKAVQDDSDKYPLWRVEDGKLYKLVMDKTDSENEDSCWKEVVPKFRRSDILKEHHDVVTAGHLGVFKTIKRIQRLYYWPKMRSDIAKYVKNCQVCQRTKYDQGKSMGLMGSRRSADEPWTMLCADLMGPFPRSTKGFKYLLVVSDTFTKYTLLFPLRAATATSVAHHLLDDVFMVYGVPKYLICDNGSEFIGSPVKRLAEEYKFKLLLNASRHPQANPTERTNRTLISMLRAYIKDNHRLWDKDLPKIGFALRSAVSETTGYSPAYLSFGRELNATGTGFGLLKDWTQVPDVPEGRPTEAVKKLIDVFKVVKANIEKSHSKNEKIYNLRRRPAEFEVGDRVLKKNFEQSNAANYYSSKLTPRYVGPYKIRQKISPNVYQLEEPGGKIIGTWHISDLKRHEE